MTNGINLFGERAQTYSLAEIRNRLSLVDAATETARASVIVEFGAGVVQPTKTATETNGRAATVSNTTRQPQNPAQFGNSAVNHERRQLTATEVEGLGQQRFAADARFNVDQALLEGENHERVA